MIKYLPYILILLLSGCTADFSGLRPEKTVHICFSTTADIHVNVSVSETTRSAIVAPKATIGILGIGAKTDLLNEIELAGYKNESLRQWMANDVYHLNGKNITHAQGQYPSFPIEDNSAVAAYAYLPHTKNIVYGEDDCYIPIDLMADSATTDWMYSGRVAKTKEEYCDEPIFAFNFSHAMTRLDLVISPEIFTNDIVRILEIDLGLYSHGKGFLSLEDGTVSMDTATCCTDSVYHLRRRPTDAIFTTQGTTNQTDTWYLMPYTDICKLSITSLWNETDTICYEHYIDDSIWNSANLRPGERSVINIKSIRKK